MVINHHWHHQNHSIIVSLMILDEILPNCSRFTCTAQNGFGVDMVSSFLYPLAPAFYDYSQ